MPGILFPQPSARDLDRCEAAAPAELPGNREVVIVAFREQPQERARRLARPAIDGEIAAATGDQQTRGAP